MVHRLTPPPRHHQREHKITRRKRKRLIEIRGREDTDHTTPTRERENKPNAEFDSSLGYPGEGHRSKNRLKIATLNVAGLNDTQNDKFRRLIKWVRGLDLDVLCVQEHNAGSSKMKEWQRIAHANGYCIRLGTKGDKRTRGGAALIAKMSTLALTEKDSGKHRDLDGGYVKLACAWQQHKIDFVSLYVPSQEQDRKSYLTKLKRSGAISKNSIVLGDFNCVENTLLDVRYPEGSNSKYANQHSGLLMHVMAKAGLGDVFRKVHGNTARAYTRNGSSVRTRLDRIYAKEYSSGRVWHTHWLDATYAKWIKTDHVPVVAEMSLLGKSKSNPNSARINKELYEDPMIRDKIKEIVEETKKRHSKAGQDQAIHIWEEIKSEAHAMLMKETKERKKLANRPVNAAIATLEDVLSYKQRSTSVPSKERDEDIKAIKDAINQEMGKLPPSGPKTSLKRYEKEEECTKGFYQYFRAKHANMNIEEINVVNDWDSPESEDSTDEQETIKSQIFKYYEWLYKEKSTSSEHEEALLENMRGNPIPQDIAKRADAKIKLEEVITAIRRTANNKSPGPDGLPGEFYRAFETMLAQPLKEAIIEAQRTNRLPPSMLEGDITLIYKKKDPKDIRNYRPITLLNVDYKILTKILADKLKIVCEATISAPQKGFVPGRQITDLTRQMYLLQDYVEAQNQEALLVMLDMEKAFDRCSWEFLKKSMRTMGIGENMMKWIEMIYSEDTPPCRNLKINGFKGESFKLGSGVAQGCPLSPLLFLFIGEPLTRAIEADEELEGITIGDYEHRVSQFADDTAAYLKDISQSKRLLEIVGDWEDATAMRANRAKTAVIPIGKTVRDFQRDKLELTRLLNEIGLPGPSEEEWEIYLGAPIASNKKVYKTFLEKKYMSMKKKLSRWKGLNGLTAHGRTIVANFLIFSQRSNTPVSYTHLTLPTTPYV